MNPRQTAAVAPVNWKATQMLGMKFAPKKISIKSPEVIKANLVVDWGKGLAEGKKRPSMLILSG